MKTPEPLSTVEAEISAYDMEGGARVAEAMVVDIGGDSVYLTASECREIAAKLTEIAAWIEAGR
jgi:hypothetical protein